MSLALYLSRVRSSEVLGRAPLFDNGKHKWPDSMLKRNEIGLLHPSDGRNRLFLNSTGTVQELA